MRPPPARRKRPIEPRDGTRATRPRQRFETLALAATVLGASAANLWWIRRDAAPWPHPNDPYIYLANTLRFVDELGAQGWSDPGGALTRLSYGGRPPLYQLLSLPCVWLFGRSEDAALLVNVFLVAVGIVCVYGIGRIAANGRAGLLAALLVAAYPPGLHLSRIYRPHGVIPAFVALSFLLLLLLRGRRIRTAWALGAALAAGILVHPTFAYAVVVPVLLGGGYVALFQVSPRRPASLAATPAWLVAKLRDPLVLRGLLPATLLVLAAASWYPIAAGELVATAERFAEARAVRVGFLDVAPDFWWYARTAPRALSNLLAGLALLGALWCLLRGAFAARLAAIALLAGYAIQALTWVRAWWYFAALLPFAAVVTASWIAALRPARLAAGVASLAASVALFVFASGTWGLPPSVRPLAAALGAPLDAPECRAISRETAFCATPPSPEPWPTAGLVDAILRDAPDCATGDRTCRAFLAVNFTIRSATSTRPAIKSSLFEFIRVRDHPGARIDFLNPRKRESCGRELALESDYLVHFAPAEGGEQACHLQWSRFLASAPRSFYASRSELAALPLPGGGTARLLGRTRALTTLEARRIKAAWRAAGNAIP